MRTLTLDLVLHGHMKGPLIAVGAFVLVALALVTWVTIQTEVTGENPLSSTDTGDRSRVAFLSTDDCFQAGSDVDEQREVVVLDCAEPHDSEVVWTDAFSTYGSEGEDALDEARAEAEDECRDRFDAYVDALPAGTDPELRPYLDGGVSKMRDFGTDEMKWNVACVAWSPDGPFSD